MLDEFKKFALRGNVVDLAIGVVIGAAFGAIVASLVADIIMPIIGAVTGGLDFSNYCVPLNERFFSISHYDRPVIDEKSWALRVGGSVARPLRLTLNDIKARPRRDVIFLGIETSVGRALLKSVPAKVTRQGNQYRIIGAAWGRPRGTTDRWRRVDPGRYRPQRGSGPCMEDLVPRLGPAGPG